MISQNELPTIIEDELPELAPVCQSDDAHKPYRMASVLIQYTRQQLVQHNLGKARNCMALVERLYQKGNYSVRHAIENVYVFALSHTFMHGVEGGELKRMLPAGLSELYKQQVLYSHI